MEKKKKKKKKLKLQGGWKRQRWKGTVRESTSRLKTQKTRNLSC